MGYLDDNEKVREVRESSRMTSKIRRQSTRVFKSIGFDTEISQVGFGKPWTEEHKSLGLVVNHGGHGRPEIVNLSLLLLYNFSNEPWSKCIKGDRGRKEGISRGTNSRQKLVSFSFYDLRALPKISQVFLILKII